jgi:shikimate dehydrogenase
MSDLYAVIGNPIGHSKSPLIHASFAKATGQDIDYIAIEGQTGSPDAFAQDVADFISRGGRGMNVTAPFKLQAFDLATDRLERARLAGATNALKFEGDKIVADNFDGVGLVNDIVRNLGVALAGKRVLMLGAGGAARGALLPFLAQKPAELVLANRSVDKATSLAAQFSANGRVIGCGYADLVGQGFDVVINATSASLKGELPPVPPSVFGHDALAYELVYGKGLTPFLRLARNAGISRLADGVGMLVEQAAEAFVWWRGVRPDTRDVIARLTVPLI